MRLGATVSDFGWFGFAARIGYEGLPRSWMLGCPEIAGRSSEGRCGSHDFNDRPLRLSTDISYNVYDFC